MHGDFESVAPVIEQLMNTAGLEQIPNAQEHFDVIQRLVQKIGCTTMQRPALGFHVDVGRENDDWQVNLASNGTQGFENRESIKLWHEQIEQDQARVELVANFEALAGNRCGLTLGVT